MTGIRSLLFLSLTMLLAACSPKTESPFSLDAEGGSFKLEAEGCSPGPYVVKLNNIEAIKGAHIFQGKDSLVAIGSCGGLDVLLVFKENAGKPLMQISVINPTDSAMEMSSLELYSQPCTDKTPGSYRGQVRAGKDALWQWSIEENKAGICCSLDLSGSSLYLLPEEHILLPPLHFFSHLCSE